MFCVTALLLLCPHSCMLLWCHLSTPVLDASLNPDTDARSPFLHGFDLTQGLPEWPWDDPVGGIRECEGDYGSLRTSDLKVSLSLRKVGACSFALHTFV